MALYGAGIFLAFVTSFKGPYYYSNWGAEHTLFTSGSSMQFIIAGIVALVCFSIARHHGKRGTGGVLRPWVWLVVAGGFFYAAVDELGCVHERAGEILDSALPWFSKMYVNSNDDVFVITYGILALFASVLVLREMRPFRKSVYFYIVGMFLLLLAGLMDYVPESIIRRASLQGVEDLAEYFAGTSFSASFLLYGLDRTRLALMDWLVSLTPTYSAGEEADAALKR